MYDSRYNVNETNNIADASYNHTSVDYSRYTRLGDPELVRIDRVRLLTDPGCPVMDVSYVYGTLRNGTHVRVDIGASQISRQYKGALIALAKQAGVYAKGLHMLDNDVISILR